MKAHAARFSPHPLIRGGNAQTLAAALLPSPLVPYHAKRRLVKLPDGDRLMLHDDRPAEWSRGEKAVLLIHGLGGTHASPYLVRIAEKLTRRGLRTFRMDLRGCGAGEDHARGAAHCGSWDDIRRAIDRVGQLCPGSPVDVVGFSLGGALALHVAGRLAEQPCDHLAGVMAVCPPIDLHELDRRFRRGAGRLYSRYLAGVMWRQIQRRLRKMDDPPVVDTSRRPRHIRELDEQITAPFHGFRNADHYYDETSVARRLPDIRTPTRIVAAADDPVIPVRALLRAPRSEWVQVQVAASGGHLGFFGNQPGDPDAWWIDWRVVDWVSRGD